MKDEFIYLSKLGTAALFFIGVMVGGMLTGHFDGGSFVVLVMLVFAVRSDVRECPVSGEYKRGWIFMHRIGPVRPLAGVNGA